MNKIMVVGNLYPDNERKPEVGRIYDPKGLSPCLNSCGGGNRMPKIIATEGEGDNMSDTKIRKITPCECWKLMGFTPEDFQKAKDTGISNSQLYKQAGNSIVVNVLEQIFINLSKTYEDFEIKERL